MFQADSDELCFLQGPGGGTNIDKGVNFFTALLQRVNASSPSRALTLDEITIDRLRELTDSRPDAFQNVRKAIDKVAGVGMDDSALQRG